MRTWHYSCCKYITDQLNTLWEIILNPWLPRTNVFHCHYSFENPSGLSGFSCTRKKFILPPLSYYNYEIHFPSSDHGWVKAKSGWRQCQSEEHLFALNPLSSAPSILRVTLKCWISTTVNNLPCIRKQSNTQKAPRFKACCRSAIIFCRKGTPGTKQWGGPAWDFVRCIWLEPG